MPPSLSPRVRGNHFQPNIGLMRAGSVPARRRIIFKNPMWITPLSPAANALRDGHMGQFSVEIICLPGSVLGGNQHRAGLIAGLTAGFIGHMKIVYL